MSQAQPKTGEQYLQQIGRDLLAGAQNFDQKAPRIQKMLLDLMAALDGMRGGQQAPPPGQRTLPHMFGKQALEPSNDQAPQGKPVQYDISDSQPTDPLVGDTGGGEKRKIEQISSQQGDDSGSCTGDEKPMEVVHVVPTAAPLDGAPPSQPQPEQAEARDAERQFSRDPRDALRHSLMAQKDAQAKTAKARSERRSTPYAK